LRFGQPPKRAAFSPLAPVSAKEITMASLLKNLLGNSANNRDLGEEVRAALDEMRKEHDRYERLVGSAQTAAERLQEISGPMTKAVADVDSVAQRLTAIEERVDAVSKLATLYKELDDRAELLTQSHEEAQNQLSSTVQDAQRIREAMDEINGKIDAALALRDQLGAFLEVDRPFQQLRGEADTLKNQVDGTSEHLNRLREQHDRLLDAHKLAVQKMEALDRRRDELGRSMSDKERRVIVVEQSVRGLDGIHTTVEELRREIGTLKAGVDLVGQKTTALSAQGEMVDRALSQAENLDRAMRAIDAGVRQQQDNERSLAGLQEQVVNVRSLHESVIDRSNSISQLQRDMDERTEAARQELASVTEETRKSIERFDFERRGMESVTQRVADLRAALSDCEARFRPLGQTGQTVAALESQSQQLTTRFETLMAQANTIENEAVKLDGIRRDLDETSRTVYDVNSQFASIRQSQPAIEAALRDLAGLASAHAAVRDSLEQAQLAHSEITRVQDGQAQTRIWIGEMEQQITALKDQVSEVHQLAPAMENALRQAQRVGEATNMIESRREFLDEVGRRAAELTSIASRLDERAHQLQVRMETADQRFVSLGTQAEEAERLANTISTVTSGVQDAEQKAGEISRLVEGIAARSEQVETLGARIQTMKAELDQRQKGLAEAAKELNRVSQLRQDAAGTAQELDALSQSLASALGESESRSKKLVALTGQLESRGAVLSNVEQRMTTFEQRIDKWKLVDEDVTRSLDQLTARQDTIESLKGDLERMYAMAEQTSEHVRSITGSHAEIEASRELLADLSARMAEVREAESSLDERKRQMAKAEERLARAEGLLADVRSSLESIHGQKALVDQAVEKAGSLQYLLKQADAAIHGIREERKSALFVKSAVDAARDVEDEDWEDDDQIEAKAA
jgi:DNA repair exonuclease SbcCD ATPase subunit